MEPLNLPGFSLVKPPRSFRSFSASITYTLDTAQDCCIRLRLVNRNKVKLVPFFVRIFMRYRFSSIGEFPFTRRSQGGECVTIRRLAFPFPFDRLSFPHSSFFAQNLSPTWL
ncbi:hypothetical protein [Parasitella parasitica]|uniref:Uncharacterized protein n=1 Tax=Parasitella parasitica TaxID=35722 RepID=A0A0B7MV23_9FUNG|nr:hypothetical protein [Parasitella parasitica]